jgi:hypothetical protein
MRCCRVARHSPTLNSRFFRRGFTSEPLLPSLEMLTTSGLRASLKRRNTVGEGTLLSPLWVVLPCRTRTRPTHASQPLVNGQGNTVVSTAHGRTVPTISRDSSRGQAKCHPRFLSVTSHQRMMVVLTHPLFSMWDQDSGENGLARVSTGPSRLV